MFRIDFDDTAVRAELHLLLGRIANPLPALQDIGEALAESTKARFVTSTDPDGAAWEPLAESTLMRLLGARRGALSKRRTKAGGRTLNQSGMRFVASRRPLIGESKRLSREIHYRATPHQVEIGSSLIQAGVMQRGAKKHAFTGGKTPWGDIPARRFLGVSAADRQTIRTIWAEHLGG